MKRFYGSISLQDAQSLKLYDADSSNFTALKAPANLSGDLTLTLPNGDSTGSQALTSNGSGTLSWVSYLSPTLTSANIFVGNGSNVATGVALTGDISIDNTGLSAIVAGVIVNADINASAAIAFSKMAALTASRALASDGSGVVTASSTTSTELGYVSGVTSNIQTQLNNLSSSLLNFEWQPSAKDYITNNTAVPPTEVSGDRYILSHDGGAPHANYDGATAGSIVQFNGSVWVEIVPTLGMFVAVDDDASGIYHWGGSSWAFKYFEATTASTGLTKVGFDVRLDATSAGAGLGFSAGTLAVNVDDSTVEINADTVRVKALGITNSHVAAAAAIAFSKMAALTASRALVSDGSGVVSVSAVTSTELGYVAGVTSAIQTQIDGKASTALSNLASVAINTTLVSDTNNTDDLGTAAIGWKEGFINKVSMDSNSQTTSIQGSASASASVTYSLPPADGTSGFVLSTNGSGALSWISNASVTSYKDNWVTADTATKVITHNLGTKDVMVYIYDKADDNQIQIDSVVHTSINSITVTASSAPNASGYRVLILAT